MLNPVIHRIIEHQAIVRPDAIAAIEGVEPARVKQSLVYSMRFPPQEHKIAAGTMVDLVPLYAFGTPETTTIVSCTPARRPAHAAAAQNRGKAASRNLASDMNGRGGNTRDNGAMRLAQA